MIELVDDGYDPEEEEKEYARQARLQKRMQQRRNGLIRRLGPLETDLKHCPVHCDAWWKLWLEIQGIREEIERLEPML